MYPRDNSTILHHDEIRFQKENLSGLGRYGHMTMIAAEEVWLKCPTSDQCLSNITWRKSSQATTYMRRHPFSSRSLIRNLFSNIIKIGASNFTSPSEANPFELQFW